MAGPEESWLGLLLESLPEEVAQHGHCTTYNNAALASMRAEHGFHWQQWHVLLTALCLLPYVKDRACTTLSGQHTACWLHRRLWQERTSYCTDGHSMHDLLTARTGCHGGHARGAPMTTGSAC